MIAVSANASPKVLHGGHDREMRNRRFAIKIMGDENEKKVMLIFVASGKQTKKMGLSSTSRPFHHPSLSLAHLCGQRTNTNFAFANCFVGSVFCCFDDSTSDVASFCSKLHVSVKQNVIRSACADEQRQLLLRLTKNNNTIPGQSNSATDCECVGESSWIIILNVLMPDECEYLRRITTEGRIFINKSVPSQKWSKCDCELECVEFYKGNIHTEPHNDDAFMHCVFSSFVRKKWLIIAHSAIQRSHRKNKPSCVPTPSENMKMRSVSQRKSNLHNVKFRREWLCWCGRSKSIISFPCVIFVRILLPLNHCHFRSFYVI